MKFLGVLPLVLILFSIRHVPVARGVKCLACADVSNARDCAFVQECPAHQVCSGELFVTAAGNVRHRMGCRDKSTCGSGIAGPGVSHVACSQCCETPLCNSQLCYDSGYGPRSSRGPVCYNCPSQTDPAQCHTVKVCSVDETCGVIQYNVGFLTSYRIACVPKTFCIALHAPGKCTGCCADDLCTNNCTAHHTPPQITQTISSSSTSRTPTTTQTTSPTTSTRPTTTQTTSPTTQTTPTTAPTTYTSPTTSTTPSIPTTTSTMSSTTTRRGAMTSLSQTTDGSATGCADDINCHTVIGMYQSVSTVCSNALLSVKYCMKTCGMCTPPTPPTPATLTVDGQWSAYHGWSACSATCGTGERTRTRFCDNPRPAYGGADCVGSSILKESCYVTPCPVDGQWSAYHGWTACSATCGTGARFRYRLCDNPIPAYGGTDCVGSGIAKESCYATPCPVDGQWSSWLGWSACSATCGIGVTHRTRRCDNPIPAHGGNDCLGNSAQSQMCPGQPCPVAVDGQWSSWPTWTACSTTCGPGERTRTRVCDNPSPTHGGDGCVGNTLQRKECHLQRCPPTTKLSPVCLGCLFDDLHFCNWDHSSHEWDFKSGDSRTTYGPHWDYHDANHAIGSYVSTNWGHHASLASPLLRTDSRWCFSAQFYMHGVYGDAGILIYTRNERTGKDRRLLSFHGDQGRRWVHKQDTLHPYFRSSDYRLIITTVSHYGMGYIAIDDIELCEC